MKEQSLSFNNISNILAIINQNFEVVIVLMFMTFILISIKYMSDIRRNTRALKSSPVDSEKVLQLIVDLRELLDATRRDSFTALEKANNESLEILKQNTKVSENMQEMIRKKAELIKKNYLQDLKKSSLQLSQQFQDSYKKEFALSLKELKDSNSKVTKKLLEEADSLIQDIHKHLTENHDLIIKKLDDDLLKTDEFLSEYKKNKVEELEKEFKYLANSYVKDYLKKTLTFEEHEQIIKTIIKDFERDYK